MIKTIIFDLDGTLANTIEDITCGLNGMLYEYGFPLVTADDTLRNINNGALELVRRSIPESRRNDESFVKEAKRTYEKYYNKCFNDTTYAYSGIHEALLKLQEGEYSLNVLSNKQDEFVKLIVKKLFPDVKFDYILGQSEAFPTKPDPTAVLHIINEVGADIKSTAIVGDSNVDMVTAKNACIVPLGVSWGYRSSDILLENGAKHIFSDPSELVNIPDFLI